MAQVHYFTFSPFYENTYIVFDETKECIIFDPGCSNDNERSRLKKWLEKEGLKPVRLINTHCHLDHVFGNAFIAKEYNLGLEIHEGELPILANFKSSLQRFGLPDMEASPTPSNFIKEGDIIKFGNTTLKALFVPGHSPASLCFYDEQSKFVIAGDTLFEGSIGRTDLPGGNHDLLLKKIKEQLFVLPNEVAVYPGHGAPTTIGKEKATNPFLID